MLRAFVGEWFIRYFPHSLLWFLGTDNSESRKERMVCAVRGAWRKTLKVLGRCLRLMGVSNTDALSLRWAVRKPLGSEGKRALFVIFPICCCGFGARQQRITKGTNSLRIGGLPG